MAVILNVKGHLLSELQTPRRESIRRENVVQESKNSKDMRIKADGVRLAIGIS